MSHRVASWLAWIMCVLSVALTALSLWLLVLCLSYPDVPVYSSFWAENVLQALGFSTVGAVIVTFGSPRNPIGWLFCTMGLLFGAAHCAAQYANYAVFAVPGSLPGGEVAAWMWIWSAFLGVGLFMFLFLLFPDGRLPSSRWRWFARLGAFLMAAAVVLVAFSPGPIVVALPDINNPFGIEGLPNAYKAVQLFILLLVLVALGSVLVRWVRARGVERQQIKWFAYAVTVLGSGIVLKYFISEPFELAWLGWVGRPLVLAGLAGIPLSMGIAVLRYRLYDIDIIINRTLVYGSLTATLVALYFGGVVVLQRVFVLLTGQQSTLAVVASTLLIAALFTPLRRRIQGFIDRRFYRRKYDARKTLEAFSTKLKNETDLESLNNDLVGVVRETMQPAHVSFWLRPDARRKGEEAG
jgi:hypothetical protein